MTRINVDYMVLIETSLTAAQAAAMLGVDVSRVLQRLRERMPFGIDYEGEWRLPHFQFERKKVLPGLNEVLPALAPQIACGERAKASPGPAARHQLGRGCRNASSTLASSAA